MIDAYKISRELKDLEELLEETNGEAPDAVLDCLNLLYKQQDERLEAINSLMIRAEAQLTLIAAESAKLKESKAMVERKLEALTNQAEVLLARADRWEKGLRSLSWKQSQAIEIEPGTVLPEPYIRVKEVREADKVMLTKDIKAGATIPGVKLASRYSLKAR